MWLALVNYFFSNKFQKWSTNGKRARGKQLHPHTSGSQSFAIKRDKFEKEHQREPGPLQWFMETHQDKDESYHEPVSQKFVVFQPRRSAGGKENVQVDDQTVRVWEKTNVTGFSNSKELNIARRLNFDHREQLSHIQATTKGPSFTMRSSLSKEPNCSIGIKPSGMNGQCGQQRHSLTTQDSCNKGNHSSREEMLCMSHSLTQAKSPQAEFRSSNDGVAGDGCRRLVGSSNSQQAENSISIQKRKEVDTSNLQHGINLSKKKTTMIQHKQNQPASNQAFNECKQRVDKDILSKIIWDKLMATLEQPGCIS